MPEGGAELVRVDVHQFQGADGLACCLFFGDAVTRGPLVGAELAQGQRVDGLLLGRLMQGQGEPEGVKCSGPALSGLLPDGVEQALHVLVLRPDDGDDVVGCGRPRRSSLRARPAGRR